MSLLTEIISNQARAEIFKLLFSRNQSEMHLREMVRQSKLSLHSFQKEIAHLKKLDLIISTKDGNRIKYKANAEHPIYPALLDIVEKTTGVVELLKSIIRELPNIDAAFIFGSYATGTEKAHSDIDIIVVGDITLRSLTPFLKKITDVAGREVNPHVYTMKSWREKLKKSDHFIKSVIKSEKVFLVGDSDVLS